MSLGGRAAAMAQRVSRAARRAGLADADVDRLGAALQAALAPRMARLDNEDPEVLHPARTVLILLEDLDVVDPDALVAAALCETLRPALAPGSGAIEGVASERVLELLRQVPGAVEMLGGGGAWGPPPDPSSPAERGDAMAEPDTLLERLVSADHDAILVALAERLDHARHLHLRPEAEWAAVHARTCRVYRPVAERAHPTLARRYRWWCNTFQRRFLGG